MRRSTKFAIVAVTFAAAIAAFGVYFVRNVAVDSAEDSYRAGDLSGTLAELSHRGEVDVPSVLLAANCYRQLGQIAACREYAKQAQAVDGAAEAANLIMAMLRIQNGQLDAEPAELIEVLVSAGAEDSDARAAVVSGVMASGQFDQAASLLEKWQTQEPASAHRMHLSAVLANLTNQSSLAEEIWIDTVTQYPRFELAWLALAEFYSRPPNVRFAKAELVLNEVAGRFPSNLEAREKLSRVQRRLGHAEQSALAELPSNPTEAEILEAAAVQFDTGKVADSLRSFEQLNLRAAEDFNRLTDTAFGLALRGDEEIGSKISERVSLAATALALSGEREKAQRVFDVAIDRQARLRRLEDLNVRTRLFANRQEIIDESNAVVSPAFTPNYPTLKQLAGPAETKIDLAGYTVYKSRCAHCHGANGDGLGVAAVNLFPPPRSFRSEPIRFVSSEERMPTDGDLEHTIRNGEPGTSMPAFADLSQTDISALIQVLRRFQLVGKRGSIGTLEGEAADQSVVEVLVVEKPKSIPVPVIATTEEASRRGRDAFVSAGCGGCHAVETGPFLQPPLFDSRGIPVVAPNLAADPFHGGAEPSDIYNRIVLGIPGTPHPALASVSSGDAEAIAAYVLSIHNPRTEHFTNQQRAEKARNVPQP